MRSGSLSLWDPHPGSLVTKLLTEGGAECTVQMRDTKTTFDYELLVTSLFSHMVKNLSLCGPNVGSTALSNRHTIR